METGLPDATTANDGAAARPTGRDLAMLLVLLVLAGALRVSVALDAAIIAPDALTFLTFARQLCEAPLEALRGQDQHPLFPGMIAGAHRLGRGALPAGSAGWITAGHAVALTAGLVAVALVWLLAWQLYGRGAALAAALGFAFLPDAVQLSGDVLSDMPHLALYLGGICLLCQALRGRARLLPLVGVLGGLAFLVRPEGGSVAVVAAALVLLLPGRRIPARVGWAGAVVAGFLLVAGPYQLATGKLVNKKSLLRLLQFDVEPEAARGVDDTARPAPPAAHAGVLAAGVGAQPATVQVLYQWLRSSRVVFFVLAVLGLFAARPRAPGGALLSAAIGLHVLVLHALVIEHAYVDRRHALLLTALAMPLAGCGACWLGARLADGARPRGAPAGRRAELAALGLVLVCVAALWPYSIRRLNAGEAHLRVGAAWLRAGTPPDAVLVTDQHLARMAFYADRRWAFWRWWQGNVRFIDEFVRTEGAALGAAEGRLYFAFDERWMAHREGNPRFFEELAERFGGRLRQVATFPSPPWAEPTQVRVYHWDAQGGAAPAQGRPAPGREP